MGPLLGGATDIGRRHGPGYLWCCLQCCSRMVPRMHTLGRTVHSTQPPRAFSTHPTRACAGRLTAGPLSVPPACWSPLCDPQGPPWWCHNSVMVSHARAASLLVIGASANGEEVVTPVAARARFLRRGAHLAALAAARRQWVEEERERLGLPKESKDRKASLVMYSMSPSPHIHVASGRVCGLSIAQAPLSCAACVRGAPPPC